MAVVKKMKGASAKKSLKAERRSELEADVSLPEKPNVPPSKLGDYSTCLFGEKGIGKTSLSAQFPQPIVFEWEPGRKNLSILQVPDTRKKEPPLTWDRYKSYVDLLATDKGSRNISTVVQDTVDRAYEACLQSVCEEAGMKHPSEANDYGATWAKVKREFEDVMNAIAELGFTPVYISHARQQTITSRNGEAFDLVIPTCQGVAWQYMKAACDLAIYYGYRGRDRIFRIRGDEVIWAACGLEERFLTPDKKNFLYEIPAGNSAKEAYHNLLLAFDNRMKAQDADE